MSATASPPDADDLALDPPLASTRTFTPASSPPVTTTPTNNSDVCLICLETLTPQPTPTSSTSSLGEPLLPVSASVTDATRPTLVAIATQPPTATCGCKYRVHPACLQMWFAHQPVCPLCRTGVNNGTSTDGPRTPGADEGSPPRTTRTLVVWQGDPDSPLESEDTNAQDEMDRERCGFCQRLLCVLAGVSLAYIVISVLSVPQDAWPDGGNETAS